MQSQPTQAATLMRRATYASVSVAAVLIVVKALAFSLTGSVSLLATLFDSSLDLLASLVNLFAIRHALTPADHEHRFGHGKAEALAGLGQSLLVAGSAIFLVVESSRRLQDPAPLDAWLPGVAVMVFATALTLALVMYQRYVLARVDSTAISADSLHYRADLLVNIGVIAALCLSTWGWPGFDAVIALFIAVYILASISDVLRQSLDHLMDRELPDSQRDEVERLVLAHSDVRGMHDLRSRRSGTRRFLQLHLELDDDLSLFRAHAIADEVELALLQAFPDAEILIHIDPVSVSPDGAVPPFDR